ncbi:MAG TPA: kelch repeat-containing protein [Candidatus Limnocylindria bacterium]
MAEQTPPIRELTAREQEVLAMVAEGHTNREIGVALFISESTAGVHVSNIMAKLGVASRTEAAAFAIRAGLVEGAAAPETTGTVPMSEGERAAGTSRARVEDPPQEPPPPAGWWARAKTQARRHPRSTAIAAGSVVVLAAIAAGLGFAVLTGEPSTGIAAVRTVASPTASLGVAETSRASAALSLGPTPSGSASATPTASAAPSPSDAASASEMPTPRPGPENTPQPTPPGTWVASASMIDERQGHTATLLGDGTLLVIGGYTEQMECASTVERYDPPSDQWADETELPDERHCLHTATLLDDGSVLVAGGPTAATYDASRQSWQPAGDHAVARFNPSAVLLEDGSVLVIGGWVGETEGLPTASVELFDPAARLWSAGPDMAQPRVDHVAVRLEDGSVLVAGGYSSPRIGSVASAETFDPGAQAWTRNPDMSMRRVGAAAILLPNGQVLVAGGHSGTGVGLALTELFNPATGRWSPTGSMHVGRIAPSMSLLPDGDVLVVGGAVGGPTQDTTGTTERYDPATGTWSLDAPLDRPRADHTATVLEDGSTLVVGGEDRAEVVSTVVRYVLRR